ncbi:MAG: 3-keto-disaccharide hydrolase [Candidatus Acidiferrales bacterium]
MRNAPSVVALAASVLAVALIAISATRQTAAAHAPQASQTATSNQTLPGSSTAAAQGQTPSGLASVTPAAGRGRGNLREPDPIDFDDRAAYTEMFDGATLNGWDGNPDVWKVVDGAIVGERPVPPLGTTATPFRQTFLVWQGEQPADFELKLEIKLEGRSADSGIQYRSFIAPLNAGRAGVPPPDPREAKWNLAGYQFDFNLNSTYVGQIAEGGGRGIIAYRGQVVRTEEGKNPRLIAELGDRLELGGYFKHDDWNQVDLIAHGDTSIGIINGHTMVVLIDDDAAKAKAKGLIGLQYSGPSGTRISFRNVRIRNIL